MDENYEPLSPQTEPTEEENYEPSHSDKLVGVFTEPANTFEETSKFPPKAMDWLIPIVLVIIVAALSNYLIMSNPEIKLAVIEKQMEQIEERFDEMVEQGQMTQDQADQQLDQIRDRMESGMGNILFSLIGIVIFTFVAFFVVSAVFFLFAKFIYKDTGNYSAAMVAYGLPHYIIVIQLVVMVILAFVMNKALNGTSVAAFLDVDKSTLGGFLLSKLDVFSIWFYAVVSIAYAKMFKSDSYGKYFGMIFGLWIGFSLLLFLLAKVFPFLRWFGM